jgi:hypothetical protein
MEPEVLDLAPEPRRSSRIRTQPLQFDQRYQARSAIMKPVIPKTYKQATTLGERCVNTKTGHAQGHQSASADHLDDGLFMSGKFDSIHFQRAIDKKVTSLLREINEKDTDQ